MSDDPDPQWYLDNVLAYAEPGCAPRLPDGPAGRWQMWWRQRYLDLGEDDIGRVAREQGFVLTTTQLRSFGLSDVDLRRMQRRGEWSRPAYGAASPIAVGAGSDQTMRRRQHALRATAAALLHGDHVIGGRSSAVLYGLPTYVLPVAPELTQRPAATLGRRYGRHVFGATLADSDIASWYGAPLTSVARTVVDLARHDRRDGIMAADAALRERLVDTRALTTALEGAGGWPGVRQARAILAIASPLAESALESLTRLAMHDAGFPEPELQVVIHDSERGRSYRVDMLFREARLIIEVDGLEKYDRDEIRREKVREARLSALGYRIERILWEDVVRYWPATAARLWSALARR